MRTNVFRAVVLPSDYFRSLIARRASMPEIDELTDASVEGRIAHRNGFARDLCPYGVGTPLRRYWLQGWDSVGAVHPVISDILQAHGMVPPKAAE